MDKDEEEKAMLISIWRKAKRALEAIAVDSPNLYGFEELRNLSDAVDKYETWRSDEK